MNLGFCRIWDKKYKDRKRYYFFQSLVAMVSILIVLVTLDRLTQLVIIASLGASTFIAFAMPESELSCPKHMIGGYVVGLAVGTLCHFIMLSLMATGILFFRENADSIMGAIAVGASMFTMTVTDTEHAPAAGLSLAFVLINPWSWWSVFVVMLGISLLTLIKTLLKSHLVDLL